MLKEKLITLCNLDGPSGYENAVRDYIFQELNACDTPMEISVDAMGNILVHLIGKQKATKKVQFDAHMDEVGFIITHVCDDGTLRFETVGGIDAAVLFGHRVRIRDRIGVIGGKAGHQCSPDEMKKVPDKSTLRIDIGAANRDEAEKLVQVGEYGTFDADLTFINDTHFLGKAVDDRVGCLLLLEMAKTQPQQDIWLTFSVQEEVGLRGAGVTTEAIQPDVVVAIDATTAADTAGNTADAVVCRVGDGAVVSFADGATLYDTDLYHRIRGLAEQENIPTQTKNRIAGGNNAGAMQRRRTGAAAAAVSLPCRYIHSPACLGSIEDVQAMLDLLVCMAKELTQ